MIRDAKFIFAPLIDLLWCVWCYCEEDTPVEIFTVQKNWNLSGYFNSVKYYILS